MRRTHHGPRCAGPARFAGFAGLAGVALALACGSPAGDTAREEPRPAAAPVVAERTVWPPSRTLEIETEVMPIDRIYQSMEGPSERRIIDPTPLDWVTAYRIDVVDAADGEPLGDEFFCHSQLQIPNTTRLIVNATGYNAMEFPTGYAMPISQIVRDLPADQRGLTFFGMVLNNHIADIDVTARVRARIEYWRDADLGAGPRPRRLYKLGLPMAVDDLEAEGYEPDPGRTGDDVANACVLVEGLRTHWLVPQGRQRTRRRFTRPFPIDATVHYAVVHMHNRGVYTLLRDATTGEELWRSVVEYEPDRVQIERVPPYASAEGFKVYKDHDYEIEAVYDNPDAEPVDAMVLMDVFYNPVIQSATITYPYPPLDDHSAM